MLRIPDEVPPPPSDPVYVFPVPVDCGGGVAMGAPRSVVDPGTFMVAGGGDVLFGRLVVPIAITYPRTEIVDL